MRATIVMISLVSALCSCGGSSGSLVPDWVGTPDARRTATMQGEGDAVRDTILDEASLDYQDAESSCFGVIVRSVARDDGPLDRRGGQCVSGEARAAATVAGETVSLYDYDDRGGVQATHAESTPAAAFAELEVDPVGEGLSRVVERNGRMCCAIATGDTLSLEIGTARFVWQLR